MAALVVKELCVGCGSCATACQYGAISVGVKMAVVNADLCHDCEECVFVCPNGAVVVG